MASKGTVQTFHCLGHRVPWVHPKNGKTYKARSYVSRRANIMAITGSVCETSWGPKRWITLQLHSSLTWKSLNPELVTASTQLMLNRDDAESIVTGLLTAINEFDRQEEEERSAT